MQINKILKSTFIFLSLVIFGNSSCKDKVVVPTKEENNTSTSFDLNDIGILPSYYIGPNVELTLKGKGFQKEDIITFAPRDQQSPAINLQIKTILSDGILLNSSNEFKNGIYRILVKRGNSQRQIGQTSISAVFNPNIPDKEGMTIKGSVYANGRGIANVVVSDGNEVTRTDENGIYYLASNKSTGYVFVSIPGNYEIVNSNGNLPVFYHFLSAANQEIEIKDFELKPVNNENHVVFSIADLHLANRTDDLNQFQNGFVKDINQQIESLQSQGKKVYGLTLGDLTWDGYWYSNNFMMPEYVKQISNVKAPIFNVIGNHDNDPYVANDWLSENPFRNALGPTYYSFNLGKIHYIVLDDTEYLNKGATSGIIGDREYNGKITDQQMNWLAKDLETISSNTPIIVATHIQIHNAPSEKGTLPSFRISDGDKLINLFNRFNEVHILTGHTHVNYRVPRDNKIMEHNTAAVCATWWWTGNKGYANNHIAPDGSPGGYGIWDMNGDKIKWSYKSIGYEPTYQFRAYDLNKVHITADTYTPNASDQYKKLVPKYAYTFAGENKNNEVLINVWGYDPEWTVSVTENSVPLQVERVSSRDPLHLISYGMKRLNVNAEPTFAAANTSHMFKVKASSATSSLEIKVTDRFGNVYNETMTRPKAFSYNMR
ncbi:calcineurin-like phosphoesterase C-terminal domain-containing protein [Sphingobacterium yanglingense]|uniref:3',5'-cyclic AMP phosphodiesterase CpdA n=1 Tax=Sphingobacterium yanglingense TaxID=1437280 RepID=A0A4R6WC38_9SPHI|nr:calcineurin-like phosphoesterase family protein [Sphingobacterium yanglingense]TDQ77098.1 3',5'-cyclic AMP phosphodiesterase CpdA [Sphingobacterium yanglingense]